MDRCEINKCNSKDVLRKNNLKLTKQRLLLLDKIIEQQSTFSANSLYDLLSKDMDLVTIYRILNIFKENKIVREVLTETETKLFELSCIHNPVHPHFFCRSCKNIYCLDALKENEVDMLKNYCPDFSVEGVSVQITGLCSNCK